MPIASLGNSEWQQIELPEDTTPTTMLTREERQMLYLVARDYFTDAGDIVDAGCFLGGSTTALGLGVKEWEKRSGRAAKARIHSYDFFTAEEWTVGKILPLDYTGGRSFLPIYEEQIAGVRDLVEIHAGDITQDPWPGGPIEILFIDVAKSPHVSDFMVRSFFPALIPGHSLVIQQDYMFDKWNAWLHVTMEHFADYFEIVGQTQFNSVIFRYTKEIPAELLQVDTIGSMKAGRKVRLMTAAIDRFDPSYRPMMEASHRQYMTSAMWDTGYDSSGHVRATQAAVLREIDRLSQIEAELKDLRERYQRLERTIETMASRATLAQHGVRALRSVRRAFGARSR